MNWNKLHSEAREHCQYLFNKHKDDHHYLIEMDPHVARLVVNLMADAFKSGYMHASTTKTPQPECKDLLQKMHDGYMAVYKENLELVEQYRQMVRDGSGSFEIAQQHKGKCSALIHFINDIRYVLNEPPIGEDSDAYGYIFNVE